MSAACPSPSGHAGRVFVSLAVILAIAAGLWFWREQSAPALAKKGPGVVPVIGAEVVRGDVPVQLTATGTVSALQSVDIRAQISATIRSVHVREGQYVKRGDRLFTLDTRAEEANLGKAEAQIVKSRADLANAERNLKRQKELFERQFISQTALDTVQNQVDSLRAQVAADLAAAESVRVARGFGEILAPIAGRIGIVSVYPGSLVQPSGSPLVTVTQIDPINIGFTLPERELPGLQAAMSRGPIMVTAALGDSPDKPREGKLVFIDNQVDSGSGTIRLKARFDNPDGLLWPGAFVNVNLAHRLIKDALSIPAQAVQIGPDKKFIYVIEAENKVKALPVRVLLTQGGRAVIEGAEAGMKVVVEGAQNLRPGSVVAEAKPEDGQGKPAGGQRKQKPS